MPPERRVTTYIVFVTVSITGVEVMPTEPTVSVQISLPMTSGRHGFRLRCHTRPAHGSVLMSS